MPYKRFDTELVVRPDDIDMNNHVHGSRYLDYVLFARFDQMGRCYGMPMDEFLKNGWNWYQKAFHIEYKRALNIAETVIVRTWLESFEKFEVKVDFQILKKESMKVSAEGYFISTMINVKTGRAEPIPEWVIQHYVQFVE
ncbi:MAG: putative thioesterase [Bacteroidetes bacterium]|nr:putative thioesterase [Bacteroidota bacterium]